MNQNTGADAPRIAIACQGGGSHTAFTAGALRALLLGDATLPARICAFSGTSGGAVCALLAWYGLLLDAAASEATPQTAQRGRRSADLLADFWRDNSAGGLWERLFNEWLVGGARLGDSGHLPSFAATPYSPAAEYLQQGLQALAPRREFVDLGELLDQQVDFARAAALQPTAAPRLLVAAVEVLGGQFRCFDSARGEIDRDAVLASGALPELFKAVAIGDGRYWDGLLSQNPPLAPLLDAAAADKPDEIWLLRINPQRRDSEPRSAVDIADRRNELAGNLSLNQELAAIERVNRWLADGRLCDAEKKPIRVREIGMAAEQAAGLDQASKLDRGAAHIARLLEHGERRGAEFLAALADGRARSAN